MRRLRTETATANYFNFHLELNAFFIRYAEVEVWCDGKQMQPFFKILSKGRNSFLNRSLPYISCFIFLQSFCTVEIGQCNLTVGCNRTPIIGQLQLKKYYTKSTQLNPSITELITITIATTTHLEKRKLVNLKNGVIFSFFTLSLPEMFVQNVIVVYGNF